MPAYAVSFSPKVDRQFDKLPLDAQKRIYARAMRLAADPRPSGCAKMEGEQNVYRVRVGDYRIIYEVRDAELLVLVVTVGPREHVYQRRR